MLELIVLYDICFGIYAKNIYVLYANRFSYR